ncbi:tetratricopeptide repeat-containing sensor histidine kinase [Flammeovirga sp. SJP92]|uniref:tetratricopeptide repeat-containing sensor histidine kinase n=1 Tax=Flammeovirga sp. SJP92 TaxID=1775430 RepID=UPI0007894928|nr:tetratricopeptide repeat-containing sensor histidine kinase [Flammeovirga sp. SJP92]KXX69583.1 hypothetical protein AVL50_16065 [Flammeovirga sp. SJP92]
MLTFKSLLLFYASLIVSLPVIANNNYDSLKREIDALSGRERLNFYIDICSDYSTSAEEAKQVLYFVDEALLFAEQLSDQKAIYRLKIEKIGAKAVLENNTQNLDSINVIIEELIREEEEDLLLKAYIVKGNEEVDLDEMDKARTTYSKAMKYAESLNDSSTLSVIYNNLGNVANRLRRVDEAISYYHKSLIIREKKHDKNLTRTYNNLAQMYRTIGNYEKAIVFDKKAMKEQTKNNNIFGLSISNLNLGNTYRKLNKIDSSLYFNQEALRLSQSIKDTIGFAFAFYNIASVYYSQEDYKNGVKYYEKAYPIFEEGKLKTYTATTLNSLSACYRSLGKLDKAELCLEKSEKIIQDLNSHVLRKFLHESYYYIYKDRGNYKEALKHSELFRQFSDSVLSETQIEKIANLEKDYEIKDRDYKIALLDKENELNSLKLAQQRLIRNGLVFLVLMFFVMVFVLYNKYNTKRKIEGILNMKNQALDEANQTKDLFFSIIAHELRNPLSAFKMLTNGLRSNLDHYSKEEIEEQLNDLRISANNLSDLLQNLLQWSLSQTDRITIDLKQHDIKVLLDDVLFQVNSLAVQKGIVIDKEKVLSMNAEFDWNTMEFVIRNLLVNALKFSDHNSSIELETQDEIEFIVITIKDYGIGMSEKDVDKLFQINYNVNHIGNSPNKGTGLGLILVDEFVRKNNGRIEVKSRLSEGTTFDIYLPK